MLFDRTVLGKVLRLLLCHVYEPGIESAVHSHYSLKAAYWPSEQILKFALINNKVCERLKSNVLRLPRFSVVKFCFLIRKRKKKKDNRSLPRYSDVSFVSHVQSSCLLQSTIFLANWQINFHDLHVLSTFQSTSLVTQTVQGKVSMLIEQVSRVL